MASDSGREQLPGYLATQSARFSAAEIRTRLDEEADRFISALKGIDDRMAHQRPGTNDWSVAEIVDHVTLTLDDVGCILATLMSGSRPARTMTIGVSPVNASHTLSELVTRLRSSQAAVSKLLAEAVDEPHTDLRVAEYDFGEINWKGYALILRLHYKDHADQIKRALAGVANRASQV